MRSSSFRPNCLWVVGIAALACACRSEETVLYGDPANVAGGGSDNGTATSTMCEPDLNCSVSFQDDVFPILDTKAGCGKTPTCHGDGAGELTLIAGDADNYLTTLSAYTLLDEGPYIVPCDPDASKLLCNLRPLTGETNPFGTCGSRMPKNAEDGPTEAEINLIKDWILCGAPDN